VRSCSRPPSGAPYITPTAAATQDPLLQRDYWVAGLNTLLQLNHGFCEGLGRHRGGSSEFSKRPFIEYGNRLVI
jgi:hypothetical protein